MSSQKLILTKQLSFPVRCKCSGCGVVNDAAIEFAVTAEAVVNSGSPFGRKERAQKNAEFNLQKNMRYHIMKLYEESEKYPDKFIRYLVQRDCSSCGKLYPWREISGATRIASDERVKSGLIPGIFSLSSKKFKSTKKM